MSCLHVGMPKTGTTTLQMRVYPSHPDIFYLGKFYQPLPFFLNYDVAEIITRIRDERLAEPDLAVLRDKYQRLCQPALAEGRLPLWSDEEAAMAPRARVRERAQAFREVFGPCKVFLTIRNPISYIKSLYLHLVTTYQIDRQRRMMSKGLNRSYAQKPRFLTIEQWLQSMGFSPADDQRFTVANLIDTAAILEIFDTYFGKDQVRVFLFEQMLQDLPGYLSNIADFLEIDKAQCISLIGEHRDATRISQFTYDRMRAICQSTALSTIFRFGPQWLRNRMGGVTQRESHLPRAEIEIPGGWLEQIETLAKDSHRRLLERWPLPLSDYGYPL
jgi:hypothetical protein